jgi:hypothetical protein
MGAYLGVRELAQVLRGQRRLGVVRGEVVLRAVGRLLVVAEREDVALALRERVEQELRDVVPGLVRVPLQSRVKGTSVSRPNPRKLR